MTLSVASPDDRVEQLILLTERLSERLSVELAAFEARRPQDVAARVLETGRLAELYRRESARVRADPSLITGASLERRKRLAELTRTFEALVDRHVAAVAAAKTITEGLVRTIADVVAERRKPAAGYGPRAAVKMSDARAIALNRRA
jgi:hypothetical protein